MTTTNLLCHRMTEIKRNAIRKRKQNKTNNNIVITLYTQMCTKPTTIMHIKVLDVFVVMGWLVSVSFSLSYIQHLPAGKKLFKNVDIFQVALVIFVLFFPPFL